MTFKELYVSGQIEFEEIDRYIEKWNNSDDERTLAAYLGLNEAEEDVWIEDSDEALMNMLDEHEPVPGTPVTLGKTGIIVNKNGFGALPLQRVSMEKAGKLFMKAYEGGIRFYDTARAYSDSEEKMGCALSEVREHIYIATKTAATTTEEFWKDLETSLHNLKTTYIDIYQFHNPAVCPKPGDGSGLYEAMCEARRQGKIHFIGITNHRMAVAEEAIESNLYDTLQFPFNYLSTEREQALTAACKAHNMGFIAMKGLSGGLITNAAASYAYMAQYENVLPIWGVQKEEELDEFIGYITEPPILTEELTATIEKDKKELSGDFCRGCGYCMPCPVGIEINNCARMSLLLRRSPSAGHLSPEGREKMKKIENCLHCGQCKAKCPYGLDTPRLLEDNYKDYMEVINGKLL
ncbi:MAG: aldo/keto reductase [Clostridium sp.]